MVKEITIGIVALGIGACGAFWASAPAWAVGLVAWLIISAITH